MAPWATWDRQLTLSVSYIRYAKIKATNPISELPLTGFLWCSREFIVSSSFIYRGTPTPKSRRGVVLYSTRGVEHLLGNMHGISDVPFWFGFPLVPDNEEVMRESMTELLDIFPWSDEDKAMTNYIMSLFANFAKTG